MALLPFLVAALIPSAPQMRPVDTTPPAMPSLEQYRAPQSAMAKEGILGIAHICGPNPKREIWLDSNGRRYPLKLAPKLAASLGPIEKWIGRYVRVGHAMTVRFDGTLEVQTLAEVPKFLTPKNFKRLEDLFVTPKGDRRPAGQLGAKPYVTILAKFSDVPAETKPKSYYDNLMAGPYPSVAHYMSNVSNARMNVNGSVVVGWVTLPKTQAEYRNTEGVLDFGNVIRDAVAQVDSQVFFPNFFGVNVMVNADIGGGIWGLGGGLGLNIDGQDRGYGATLNGPTQEHFLMTHEMGHSLGLPHAGDQWGQQYGSIYDCMGGGSFSPAGTQVGIVGITYHAFHRWWLDWLTADKVYLAMPGTSQSIRIERRTDRVNASAYQLVRVPYGGYGSRYYTLESVKRAGYDTTAAEGMVVAEVDERRSPMVQMIDVNANNTLQDADSLLTPGRSFTQNGVTFNCTASDANGYTVTVTVNSSVPWPNRVTSTADTGPGTLREAMHFVAEAPQYPIEFRLPTSDPNYANGWWKISPASALPTITTSMTINATTQTTFGGNTNAAGPEVMLDGTNAGDYVKAFDVRGPNVTIRGFAIGNFRASGIGIEGAAVNARVVGCDLGLTPTGASAPNGWDGLTIWAGASRTTIGGTVVADRNFIAKNASHGIGIWDNVGVTEIRGNWIGFDRTGVNQGNGGAGIQIVRAADVTVGGRTATFRNAIGNSGNSGIGVWETTRLQVKGNFIGLNPTATAGARNAHDGISLANNTTDSDVGGMKGPEMNWIGPCSKGVALWDATTTRNVIAGNRVGFLTGGTTAGGLDIGLFVGSGAHHNQIGLPHRVNRIGFTNDGVYIQGSDNTVQSNVIGLNLVGTAAAAIGSTGIVIAGDAADNNRIGGDQGGQGNLVAYANLGLGNWEGDNNSIEGNAFGYTINGVVADLNGAAVAMINQANGNLIGGHHPMSSNRLAAFFRGIELWNSSSCIVLRNQIGVGSAGEAEGIFINDGSSNNVIGLPGYGNVIRNCAWGGIGVFSDAATGNSIRGNSIFGTNTPNGLAIDLGNGWVTANDALDADTGANGLTNFPVLTSANTVSGNTIIIGSLSAKPSQTFTIDFYASSAGDASGYGEAEAYLGSVTVTTNSSGVANISKAFPVPAGTFISATATGTEGTSEMSQNVVRN